MDRLIETFRPSVPSGVRFVDDGDRLRLVAERELDDLGTGVFADPTVFAAFEPPRPSCRMLGFSFAQFAMPVRASPAAPFDWSPADNVDSPPAVIPLLVEDGERVCLLAPLDGWHEQIVAVEQDAGHGPPLLRWGWHGDLRRVPAGFTTTLGIYEGRSAVEVLRRWGGEIRAAAGSRPRPADPVTTHLSYWTDNGAAYWYRTEPGRDLPASVTAKVEELDRLGIRVGSVELDSWFYPHEVSRPVSEVGYLDEVPPTGMLAWEPRPDVVPDGVRALGDALVGEPSLVLHARHISPRSPYVGSDETGPWWVDVGAHPRDPAFFRRWTADARAWGASCMEQDWMLMTWFGVCQLREEPGRALAWQRGLDEAAAADGLTLLWCMATPGDLMATVELDRIAAVRSCDDYRYADDPARLWRWYLTVNRLADALELPVSKDCFFTSSDPGEAEIDGDPHAEVEAVLAALSAGVVGIGDRLGRTDPAVVSRLCRSDGRLVTSDRPVALLDRCLFEDGSGQGLTWAGTNTGPWVYLLAVHAEDGPDPVEDRFRWRDAVREVLAGAVGAERYVCYDWRAGRIVDDGEADELSVTLDRRDWGLWVCCPVVEGSDGALAVIGDPTKLATMGRGRFAIGADPTALLTVRPLLAEAEPPVTIRVWRPATGLRDVTADELERLL